MLQEVRQKWFALLSTRTGLFLVLFLGVLTLNSLLAALDQAAGTAFVCPRGGCTRDWTDNVGNSKGRVDGAPGGGFDGASLESVAYGLSEVISNIFYGKREAKIATGGVLPDGYQNGHGSSIGYSSESTMCYEPIDVVYTWVNGSDPRHQAEVAYWRLKEKAAAEAAAAAAKSAEEAGSPVDSIESSLSGSSSSWEWLDTLSVDQVVANLTGEVVYSSDSESGETTISAEPAELPTEAVDALAEELAGRSRFEDHDELLFSLRSITQNAPWVRRIYIVTNGQVPTWLNLRDDRISVVPHSAIFVNRSHLPVFSSPAIEAHLHRIPGLSKRFLYFNDDTFFADAVVPSDFYTEARGHRVYLSWPVPNCADGCPHNWIKDGYCDDKCNTTECDYDGGDCVGDSVKGGAQNNGNAHGYYNNHHTSRSEAYRSAHRGENGQRYARPSSEIKGGWCHGSCADGWLGDRACDAQCDHPECGFDGGDCGSERFGNVEEHHPILVVRSLEPQHLASDGDSSADESFVDVKVPPLPSVSNYRLHLEEETKAILVNLSQVFPPDRTAITDAFIHEDDTWIRSSTVSQKMKSLILVVRNNADEYPATVHLTLKAKYRRRASEDGKKKKRKKGKGKKQSHPSEERQLDEVDYQQVLRINLNISRPFQVALDEGSADSGSAGSDAIEPSLISSNSEMEAEASLVETEAGNRNNVLRKRVLSDPMEHLMQQRSGNNQPKMPFNHQYPHGQLNVKDIEKEKQENMKRRLQEISHTSDHGRKIRIVEEGKEEDPASERKVPMNRVTLEEEEIQQHQLLKQEAAAAETRWHEKSWEKTLKKFIFSRTEEEVRLDAEARAFTTGGNPWIHRALQDEEAESKTHSKELPSTKRGRTEAKRHLQDMFGESLRYGNRLISRSFGHQPRKVPSHMVHMIDKDIVQELWDKWPEEWDISSASRFRSSQNMQFFFLHFYYLIHATIPWGDGSEFFTNIIDENHNGLIDDKEVRRVALLLWERGMPLEDLSKALEEDLPYDPQQDYQEHPTPECASVKNSSNATRHPSIRDLLNLDKQDAQEDSEVEKSEMAARKAEELHQLLNDYNNDEDKKEGQSVTTMPRQTAVPLHETPAPSGDDLSQGGSGFSEDSSMETAAPTPEPTPEPAPVYTPPQDDVKVLSGAYFDLVRELIARATRGEGKGVRALRPYPPSWSGNVSLKYFQGSHIEALLKSKWDNERLKYKHELVPDEEDVTFFMVRDNATIIQHNMDHILLERHKFLCINDNMNHSHPEYPAVVRTIQTLLKTIFPNPSRFELSPQERNPFTYLDEAEHLALNQRLPGLEYLQSTRTFTQLHRWEHERDIGEATRKLQARRDSENELHSESNNATEDRPTGLAGLTQVYSDQLRPHYQGVLSVYPLLMMSVILVLILLFVRRWILGQLPVGQRRGGRKVVRNSGVTPSAAFV